MVEDEDSDSSHSETEGICSNTEDVPLLMCCKGGAGRAARAVDSRELNTSGPGEPRQQASLKESHTDVLFDEDIYDAVLVAAFGKVVMDLHRNGKVVAPIRFCIFLCVLCVPLFTVQFSLALFLCLDMDLDLLIRSGSEDDDMEIITQQLLIIIVHFSFFHQMLNTLRNLFFVLNPITWTRVDHLDGQSGCSWAASVLATAPCTITAMVVKLCMLYWVSTLSTSIILACKDVTESIFNCLVITFIGDLGRSSWKFLADSFLLQFQVSKLGILRMTRYKNAPHPWALCWELPCRFGGTAEKLAALVVLFVLYSRQFVVVMFALDTNVLPVARDVCTQWRWLHGDAGHQYGVVTGAMVRWICANLVSFIRDPRTDFDRKADPARGGVCTEEYARLTWGDSLDLIWQHSRESFAFIGLLFCLLVLPMTLKSKYVRTALINEPRSAHEVADGYEEFADDRLRSLQERVEQLERQSSRQHRR